MNIKERKRQGKRRRLALTGAAGGLLALLMAAGGAQRGAVAGLEESQAQVQAPAVLSGEREDRDAQAQRAERATPARQAAARTPALKVLGSAGAASAIHPAWPEQVAGDGDELPSMQAGPGTEFPLRRPVAEQDPTH